MHLSHDFLASFALYEATPGNPTNRSLNPLLEATPIYSDRTKPKRAKRELDPERFLDRPKRRKWELRPSHLQARRYFPTHPYLAISKVLPAKLPTMAEMEGWSHERLATQFLKVCRKFK